VVKGHFSRLSTSVAVGREAILGGLGGAGGVGGGDAARCFRHILQRFMSMGWTMASHSHKHVAQQKQESLRQAQQQQHPGDQELQG